MYTLTGKVIDLHDQTPLENTNILLLGTTKTVLTNSLGQFTINNICEGFYELEISHQNCRTKIIPIKIDEDSFKKFTLEHHLEELNEIIVKADKIDKNISVKEKKINSTILEQYSNASLGDALQEISGVSSLTTGNSIVKPIINGLHSSRILILTHDVRLHDQEWGVEHAPNIDINIAENIIVSKGAAALPYGSDAIGGVIRIKPEKIPVTDTLYGKTIATTATNGRGGSISSKIIKSYDNGWFWKAQTTLKRFGDVETPHYIQSNTGVTENNFSIRLGRNKFTKGFNFFYSYFNTKIGILRASHIGSIGDLIRAINSEEPLRIEDFTYKINAPKQQITHHLAKINYFYRFENFGKLNLQYDFQFNNRLEFDIRRGDDKNKPAVDLALTTQTLTATLENDSHSDYKINGGVLFRYQNNFPNPETGVRRLIPDYNKFEAGAFLSSSYKFSNHFTVEGGFRYDFNRIDAKKFYLKTRWNERNYDENFSNIIIGNFPTQWLTNPIFTYHNISATVGFTSKITKNINLFVNYSLATRPPNPAELFSDGLHHSAAIIELGDLQLEPETSHKILTTFSGNFNLISLEASPFIHFINDFMYLEPTGVELTIRGAFPVWEYKQTRATLYGLDIDATATITSNLKLENSFQFVRGDDTQNNRPLIDMPAATLINTLTYKNKNFNNFTASLQNNSIFTQKQFPNNNFTVIIPQGGEFVEELVDVSTPPKGYQLWHLNTNMDFDLSKKIKMTVGFALRNLLNTSYRDYLNRLRYYTDNIGRNFMFNIKLNY